MKLSPYKISMYKQCPLRYKFFYVDNLIKVYRKEWPHLSFGDSIHSALREFYRIPNPNLRTWQTLERLYRKNWNRKGFSAEEEEREWGLKGLEMLKRFFEREDHSVMPVILEETLNAEYKTTILSGRVDRVDPIGKEECLIIDYKTGKEFDWEEDEEKRRLAAAIYKFLVESCKGFRVCEVVNYYLESGNKVSIKLEPSEVFSYLSSVETLAKDIAIKETKDFLPQKSKLCKWCDFLEICPEKETILNPPTADELPF